MADYGNYPFRIPEAARLASLGGIQRDLADVIAYCDLLNERSDLEKFNVVEWEALSTAAVVRYARCFAKGVRYPLDHKLFTSADSEFHDAHEYFMDMRNMHVAHSVNAFEENDVTVTIGKHFKSAKEIRAVNTGHTRVIGLSFDGPSRLKRLSKWVLTQVDEEIDREKVRLLELAQSHPLEEFRKHGILAGRADTPHVGRSRKTP